MKYKTRNQFHELINDHGYKVALEIGLGMGLNAAYLLGHTNLELLHAVENWAVHSFRKHREQTIWRCEQYGERFNLIEKNSVDAVHLFEDESLDYVYIDGCHRLRYIKQDLDLWWPKVREGGFFGGHDYVLAKGCGVIPAVNDFSLRHDREFNITNEPNENGNNKSFWLIK